ncbi:DUF998 domain-containing protein [Pseudoalteromonas sp. S16_S37]|uniref:DUF998 domain-containing protein n=1 Tax=Pseudoalteromonas sp. S16_S37 TaxID=2720228 RepID=UPI001681A9AC|nr:DUF998 domain-containing protein [Pseudoalteromonas sp. S16_S37]MBD1582738.1 DUF998 domain-containing protein [Pseudoalteromonas sp. S16_S37]
MAIQIEQPQFFEKPRFSESTNYDHVNQFCSELGAAGSPTEKISPAINNYPLGFIFCLFGWAVTQLNEANLSITICGYLIIAHGVGTWLAGYFPMDKDPYIESPTLKCKIHSCAGCIMLLSLLIAPIIIAFSPSSSYVPFWFRLVSVISVALTIYYLTKMAKAYKLQKRAGYYQRISYWLQLLWLSIFSLILTHYSNI